MRLHPSMEKALEVFFQSQGARPMWVVECLMKRDGCVYRLGVWLTAESEWAARERARTTFAVENGCRREEVRVLSSRRAR